MFSTTERLNKEPIAFIVKREAVGKDVLYSALAALRAEVRHVVEILQRNDEGKDIVNPVVLAVLEA